MIFIHSQKAEQTYETTKNILKTIKKYDFPCHILTKSTLVLRDIDLISSMQCTVTLSISSLDKHITHIFEKNVPTPKERMRTVKMLMEKDVKAGDISPNAAEKIRTKFTAEKNSLGAAVRKVLEQSIQTSKTIQKNLEAKLKEY